MDFTFVMYAALLRSLQAAGYRAVTSEDPSVRGEGDPEERIVILRHDVDRDSPNAARLAEMEHRAGLRAVYYFRRRGNGFVRGLIESVAVFGHEIGYHYETLVKARGDRDAGLHMFERELQELRRIAPVRTASMHGSPLSRWDNRALWENADPRRFGIEFEPYLDLDRERFAYITDTGRCWDGRGASLRDRMDSDRNVQVRTTPRLIAALERGDFPDALMIAAHPHRWNDRAAPWLKELIWQNFKNPAKRFLRAIRVFGSSGKDPI